MFHVILGGGISGLSAAYYLSKKINFEKIGLQLYESTNRVGGWINSFKTKSGTVFELGPKTLRSDGYVSENVLSLCEDVGLLPSVVPVKRTSPAALNSYLYINNEIVSLPRNFGSLFRIKPPFMRPLLHALWKDWRTPKMELDDESVYSFVARRFGEDYAAFPTSALVCGIFAGDSKEISVKAVMKDAFQNEQMYGSVVWGALKAVRKRKMAKRKEVREWSAWSFQDGLESLPIMIKNYLDKSHRVNLFLEKKCSKIDFNNGKAILTIDGNKQVADHLYSALPSKELAKILGNEHAFLKSELSSIPYVSVGVVNLEYDGDLLDKKGFGFLVPPNQNLPVLGVTFDSCIFPAEGKTVLTVMLGGRWFEQYFGSDPEENLLLQTAKDHVRMCLNISKDPIYSKVSILKNCIPQYVVGHSRRVASIRHYIAEHNLPLTLLGNSFDGIGINDSILLSKNSVEKVMSMEKWAT